MLTTTVINNNNTILVLIIIIIVIVVISNLETPQLRSSTSIPHTEMLPSYHSSLNRS
jgi:hypothetical protein